MKDIFETVKGLPITKLFYKLKSNGKSPVIKVRTENGEIKSAILKVSEVSYYFHPTRDKDKKPVEIIKDGEWYIIPFDGWDVSF